MMELLARNWGKALGEVLASVAGSLGSILLIALIISGQNEKVTVTNSFLSYFSGGQIGLTILSVSGVTFIALLRHRPTHQILSVFLLVFLVGPIAATSIIIGLNPGFRAGGLTDTLLYWLWLLFFGLHILWFFILLLEPTLPTAQQAGQDQENRVNKIKAGAAERAQ
jgi:hypothetical protein